MQTICVCEHSEALLDLFSQIKAAAWDLCQIDNVTNHISNLGKDADMWPAEVQALVNGGEGVLAKLPGTNVAAIGVGSNKTKRERALGLALVISAAVGGTLDDEDERLNWYGPDLKHLIAIGRTLVPDAVPDPEDVRGTLPDADSKDVGGTLPDADSEDDGGTLPVAAFSKSSTRGPYRPVDLAARLRSRAPPPAAPPPRDQDRLMQELRSQQAQVIAEKQGRADDEKAWRKSEQKLYTRLMDRDRQLVLLHQELAKKDNEIASLHGHIARLCQGD